MAYLYTGLFFPLLFFSCIGGVISSGNQTTDAVGLLSFKNYLALPYGDFLSSWVSGTLSCNNSWFGVSCDPRILRVTSLYINDYFAGGTLSGDVGSISQLANFSASNLVLGGSIPTELGRLSRLQYVDLSGNYFSGAIPSQIWHLSNVTFFNFSDNSFTGTLSPLLSNLTRCQVLSLQNNAFTGSLPSQVTLLSRLLFLNVSLNYLNGTIPSGIGALSSLQALDISSNNIDGTVPAGLYSLSNLTFLSLAQNRLSGSLLPLLGALTNLEELQLQDNAFTGPFPSQIANLVHLQYLWISNNFFSGRIPTHLGTLSLLQQVLMFNNTLHGTLSSEIGLLTVLQQLDLHSNLLSGSLPSELGLATALQVLLLQQNNFTGTIPTELGLLSLMQQLDFHGNAFTGSIPTEIGLLTGLTLLNFEPSLIPPDISLYFTPAILQNYVYELSGVLPTEIGFLSSVTDVVIYYFDSKIPTEIGLLTNADDLFLSGHAGCAIPTEIGLMTSLSIISMNSLALNGPVPSEIVLLTKLTVLDFGNNSLTGSLPSNMGDLSLLTFLDISANQITGSIPVSFADLSQISQIFIHENSLRGTVPAIFGNLTSLSILDMHANYVTGTLPSTLWFASQLQYLDISSNSFTGTIPSEFGLMAMLNDLTMSLNQISGTIPTFLGSLSNLASLILSNNILSGSIPCEIGCFAQLGVLDISSNKLTSSLPTEIGSLLRACEFRVHFNHFTGTLPSEIGNVGSNCLMVSPFVRRRGLVSVRAPLDLQLQHNFLSGSLPSEFAQISTLTTLLLHYNRFSSELPSELGTVTTLTSIAIFNNDFTGTLPSGFADMVYLNTFYASVNNFNDTLPAAWENLTGLNNLDISNSGLVCNLPICNTVTFWNTKTLADSFIIVYQPTFTNLLLHGGGIAVSVTVQIACYRCCAENLLLGGVSNCYCADFGCCDACLLSSVSQPVLLPSVVVTATVNPASHVRNLAGNVVASIAGYATFENLQFTGQPGVSYTITFTSPGLLPITSTSIAVAICPERQVHSVQDPADPFSCVCEPGYFYNSVGGVCTPCPPNTYKAASSTESDSLYELACLACPSNSGTGALVAQVSILSCHCNPFFYSVSANESSTTASHCLPCSTLGTAATACFGGNTSAPTLLAQSGIDVAFGFWITSNTSYFRPTSTSWFLIAPCPSSSTACPGGLGAEKCAAGYSGAVCGNCADGYGKLSLYTCAKCPSKEASSFLSFLIIILAIIACVLIVYFSQPQDTEKSDESAAAPPKKSRVFVDKIGLKLTITHLQIISFTGDFKTEWPTVLTRVFAIPASSSTLSSSVNNIAINCSSNPSLYVRAAVYFLLPLILSVGVFSGFLLHAIITRSPLFDSHFFLRTRRGAIALLYVAHPGIVQGLMKSILCVDVGAERLALGDVDISCNSPSFKILEAFAIISIVVYGLGGLVAVYFLLRRHADTAHDSFSFLVAGYKKERNYWDLVATAKKIILAVISLFASAPLQLFFTTWILLLSSSAIRRFKPYHANAHKRMDETSAWVLIFTVSVAMLYYTGVLGSQSSNGVAVAVILIFVNFSAVLGFLFMSARFSKLTNKPSTEVEMT